MNPVKLDRPIFELPICDVCNKPVEVMEGRNGPNFDARIFRVRCHGQTELAVITALMLIDGEVSVGRAFVRPKLENGA